MWELEKKLRYKIGIYLNVIQDLEDELNFKMGKFDYPSNDCNEEELNSLVSKAKKEVVANLEDPLVTSYLEIFKYTQCNKKVFYTNADLQLDKGYSFSEVYLESHNLTCISNILSTNFWSIKDFIV